MGCSDSKEQGLSGDDDFSGPVKQRQCTDVTFLIIKIAFLISLFGLIGYCMANGDLYRLFNGYDNCGNVCGRKNAKSDDPSFPCKGGDFTARKYLKYDVLKASTLFDVKHAKRECVANCTGEGFALFFNKCLPLSKNFTMNETNALERQGVQIGGNPLAQPFKNKTIVKNPKKQSNSSIVLDAGDLFEEIAEDMGIVWPYMIYLCLIAFGLSLFFLLMFRYAAPVMVWASLLLMVILSVGWAAYLWVAYTKVDTSTRRGEKEKSNLLPAAIMMTVVAALVVLIILVMRKRIRLVIQLFEEAAKAAAAMPLIFIQPIWTFLSLGVIIICWFYFALWIQSSGKLTHVPASEGELASTFYYYKKDTAMKFTRWYNIFAVFWMSQFVISCQHMVLAGAVSIWYFSRDKSRLGSPLLTGMMNLVKYHLGSVLLGSLIMAIIAFIKFLLKLAERAVKESDHWLMKIAYYCFRCIMNIVERIFNMISRNAYVEIAIYGKPFCASAMRGLKMLFNNVFSVAAINSVGDFVLLIVKLLITFITIGSSALMLWNKPNVHHPWLPIILIAIFSFFIAHTFISVFEMIIDTIFICFCEDCEMNDGINKPYFMNRGLMEFVENSKRVLKIKDKKDEENTPTHP